MQNMRNDCPESDGGVSASPESLLNSHADWSREMECEKRDTIFVHRAIFQTDVDSWFDISISRSQKTEGLRLEI